MDWKKIMVDGMYWEVRAVSHELPDGGDDELLEFRSREAIMPPRRVTVQRGALAEMGDGELKSAFLRALPIGGDHYGRPGKRMRDVG